MQILHPERLLEDSILEVRGDGKAGGGLVLAMQSLAGLLIRDKNLHVQEWPFFSSARKGAAIRSYLRVSRKPITIACEVTHPHITILMDSGAANFVDFAEGVPRGGTFILNTTHTPEEAAKHYKLSGRVITIAGDQLGTKYLKSPIGNISVFVSLVKAIGLDAKEAKESLLHILEKRRLPEAIRKANAELFDASLAECKEGVFDFAKPGDHVGKEFGGYGDLPIGAQTGLRISRGNMTSNYARSGSRVTFRDPNHECTGCTFCITNCPENIIQFIPDAKKGVLVTGADFSKYCKSCNECVQSCPKGLFIDAPFEEKWEEAEETHQ